MRSINKFIIKIFIAAGLIVTVVNPGHADIYKYIDSNGILHFTNTPTSSNYRLYIKERPATSSNFYATSRYDPIITAASKKHGVSVPLLKAIIKVESDYNPRAISKKGAKGLMQIMPATIKTLRIDNGFDPRENIMGGAQYFKQLFNRYKGKLPLALAAYNAGPSVVDRFRSIPPIRETEEYVQKVIKFYYIFKRGNP
ncbi:transglycosylase SLT domain-containing protein [Thermodesulfobacteriota bacterium]